MKKIARTYFPATVVNARIAESISVFFESMEDFFKKKGWKWTPHKRVGEKWIQEDYSVEVKAKYKDGAYRDILFTMRRTPGLVGQSTTRNQLNMSNDHKFSIFLPREYPANLSHIKMRAITRLWHPRISTGSYGEACITVNGEIDRILIDILYHILMDPKRIRPPKLFPKEDSGMNTIAMRWFEKDADNIHKLMLTKWDGLHEKVSLKETSGIRIIGNEEEEKVTTEDKGTTIKIIPRDEKEEEEKKAGVRII